MKLIAGTKLTQAQKAQVFSAFVYRHHAIGPGKYYKDDQAWLADHAFYFKQDGSLAARRHAQPAFLAEVA